MPDADKYTFDPGVDYTTLFGGYASALTTGLQLATPNSQHGIIAYTETMPAVTGQPTGYPANWYTFNQRGLWVVPSTGAAYAYVTGIGFRNVATQIPPNTITNGMIVDSEISLAKLDVPPGTPSGYVPTVNAGGTALEFADAVNGRVDGSITVAKLVPGVNNQFLRTLAGTVTWDTFDGTDINALLSVNRLEPTYIMPGAPLQVMATDATANFSNWMNVSDTFGDGSIVPSKLAGTGGIAGQYLIRNTTNTGWSWATPAAAAAITTSWDSGLLTLTDQTVAHTPTIITIPKLWNYKLVCASAEFGFSVNDEIDAANVSCDYDGGDPDGPFCSITVDATNFTVKILSSGLVNKLRVIRKDTGVEAFITPGSWRIKIYALN